MSWEKITGTIIPISAIIIAVYLVVLGFQFPKINKTSEDVAVLSKTLGDVPNKLEDINDRVLKLEASLGTAPAELKAHAIQLGTIANNFQNIESRFIKVSAELLSTQTAISQSTADISALRSDFKSLDQKLTRIESRLDSFENKMLPTLIEINQKFEKMVSSGRKE
ncbi:hypothetical protein [uncultured Desulfosarcina sp.]|uniref:hypothetical protein n=1 Tax=uncultured Desulfosarcina sp. TaxID=218289 RepID=UPI0029C9ABD5|nr:hypothetical protein [uncultured Desulfosarcina sp.]